MPFCCESARCRFENRLSYGELLVAGPGGSDGDTWFDFGFNMAHRMDDSDVLGAMEAASLALADSAIRNLKLHINGNCRVTPTW